MRFERTDTFKADWERLSDPEREMCRTSIKALHAAAERIVADPGQAWPSNLRVKKVASAPRVWEMTWSFSGPDGRATFEWVEIDGASGIRWRRIGGNRVFRQP
ncbi:MAG: hypothetical protein GEV09_06155 [Pseudonocardiaceae bacterium]|nr:hypothetical protein [Pseudonocardiaceae bacterium]